MQPTAHLSRLRLAAEEHRGFVLVEGVEARVGNPVA
ncbi:hypothetical protein N566_16065 [Streptomycetaceae bacterium MP113-05]|nr:hypothetical protein N566_16065 [Streptomycetaceae bacterium MP113-05]